MVKTQPKAPAGVGEAEALDGLGVGQGVPAKAAEKAAEGAKARTAGRRRDKSDTLFGLRLALSRLQRRGEKITLAAVSKEAGVSSGLIHNRYPDFAEEVRALIGKALRKQRDDKADELRQARERIKDLNQLVATQNQQLCQLASVNEMLTKELAIQKAIADGKVTKGQFGRKAPSNAPSDPPSKP